ncbi:MAG: hypothetical protein WAO02_18885 [Verrucomicrobiia bacterium]
MSKASKLRPCSALGRDISPADCGEQRQSRLACPEDCPHNPFGPANYSQLLEIEDRLDTKSLERLVTVAPDRAAMQNNMAVARRRGLHATHTFFVWNLFFAEGANQTTFARRWEQAGLAELKNDERVLWRAKMQMRIVLLEVHKVFAGGRVEAVDLLADNPTPMILQDRSLAGMASRFSTLLTWVFPLPHYWRLSGTAAIIPDVAQFSPPEIVREIVRHLGGPLTEAEMRRWLAEHFPRFEAALHAVSRLRRRQMLTGMDAKWGKAVYKLCAPFAQCRKRLDALADVEPDDLSEGEQDEGFVEAREWFDPLPKAKHLTAPGGRMVLGRVLLGQLLWRVETFGAGKLSRLRQQFETQLGQRVRFTAERVDDLGARMSHQEPAVDESLAPPRLLENPEQFTLLSSRVPALPPGVSPKDAEQELMRAAERAFLDESIPALDNRTPRAAARDPALRPKLVQLMKQRVRGHDERNLQTGRTDDINWLLRELELTEIMFDAPPWRPPPAPLAGDEADLPEPPAMDGGSGADSNRPPAPSLPDAPLEVNEAVDRLQAAMDLFDTAAAAENELVASGATLLQDAEELTLDNLAENDFCFAIPFLLQTWFALVPCGCRAPEINFAELEKTFVANLRQIESCVMVGTQEKLQSFLQSSPQPGMMLALLGGFLEAANTAPKKIRPTMAAQPVILALLKSIVEKLDEALRWK